MEFLESVKQYLDDGVVCPYMYIAKQKELSMIFRAYYPAEELVPFFFLPYAVRMRLSLL